MELETKPSRAGMLCFNKAGEVIIISTLCSTATWVFPKGHIEEGEASSQAAMRETLEEAGINARADNYLDTTSYNYLGEDIIVDWWVGTALTKPISLDIYNESDFRNVRWLPWRDAAEILSFPELKKLLLQALCLT